MTTTYIAMDWKFDAHRFASDLKRQNNAELVAAQSLSGVTAAGWWKWLNPQSSASREFPYPNMTNFLAVCNLLNLDPRDYFSLEETK